MLSANSRPNFPLWEGELDTWISLAIVLRYFDVNVNICNIKEMERRKSFLKLDTSFKTSY